MFKGVSIRTMPPILGYNKTVPIPDARVLLRVKETGDPLVAVRGYGQGRVLAYMSDPAPHWGCNLILWEDYAAFWLRCLEYSCGGK